MKDPVAITGVGLITPAGRGVLAAWHAVAEGRTALAEAPGADGPAWVRWAGRVTDPDVPDSLTARLRSQLRFLNRGARLALVAASDAVAQAAPAPDIVDHRRSLYLATGDLTAADCRALSPATRAAWRPASGALDSETLNRTTLERVNPFFLLGTLANNPFSIITAALGLAGSGTTLASHSPNGSQALDLAARSIAGGRTDLAVVVACGSWLDLVPRMEMADIGLLSKCSRGARSFRPLDRRRDGFIAGEGAAALVLERVSAAHDRGAPVLGTIEAVAGCHETASGFAPSDHITLRCMDRALAEAGIEPGDLGFVNLHGSGTRKGDRAELRSVAAMCREAEASAPLCALKPHTGHMGAASDLQEVIVCIEAIRRGAVPGTLNFSEPDAEFSGAPISATPRCTKQRRFMAVSYGLGGQSSAVVVWVPPAGAHD